MNPSDKSKYAAQAAIIASILTPSDLLFINHSSPRDCHSPALRSVSSDSSNIDNAMRLAQEQQAKAAKEAKDAAHSLPSTRLRILEKQERKVQRRPDSENHAKMAALTDRVKTSAACIEHSTHETLGELMASNGYYASDESPNMPLEVKKAMDQVTASQNLQFDLHQQIIEARKVNREIDCILATAERRRDRFSPGYSNDYESDGMDVSTTLFTESDKVILLFSKFLQRTLHR